MRRTRSWNGLVGLFGLLGIFCLATAGPAFADTTFSGLASLKAYGINADFEDPDLAPDAPDGTMNANSDTTEAASGFGPTTVPGEVIGQGWTIKVLDGTIGNFGVQDPGQTGGVDFFTRVAATPNPDDLAAPFQGRQIGFINVNGGGTADVVSKSLGTIKSGQSYTLDVAVAVRANGGGDGGADPWATAYEIGLQTLSGVDIGTFDTSGIVLNNGIAQNLTYTLSSAEAAAFVGQEAAIVIRNHNVENSGESTQAAFDNVRLNGTFGDAVFPVLTVNRQTGNISLSKTGPNLSGFVGYELNSDAGSFDPAGWLSIADNYDDSGNGTVDADDDWTELSQAGSATDLAETQISGTPNNGGTLSASIDLGNAWLRTPFEDVVGRLITSDGVERQIEVQYSGTPVQSGDLNGDGLITVADWTLFKAGQGSDFTGLSDAQAYLQGDLDNDFDHDLVDFGRFRTAFNEANGAGAFQALIGVPEPNTSALFLVAASAFLLRRRFFLAAGGLRQATALGLVLLIVLVAGAVASAAVKVDRLYQFGDDPLEGSTAPGVGLGQAPGNVNAGRTLDSVGNLGIEFQDMVANGGTYVDVSPSGLARPDAQPGELGASFSGDGQFVQTVAGGGGGFNYPFLAPSSTHSPDETKGSVDYTSIVNRGFQLWLRPAGPNTAANVQHVVHDMDEHGLRISAGGNWEMRYDGATFNTGVPVTFNQWHHVMLVIPHGIGGVAAENNTDGAVLYVNGIAVGADGGGYDLDENADLVVGANLAGTDNYYNGVMDQLEFFAWGRTALGVNHGQFSLAEDNWFLADALTGVAGDVDQNGTLQQADVDALVAGWHMEKVVNNVRVGDLTTLANGDLNFDGITDLTDAKLMIQALPGSGSGSGLDASALLALAGGVPEPASMVLAGLGAAMALGIATRRRRSS